MSKKKKGSKNPKSNGKIPEGVEIFAGLSFKKFKKKNSDAYDSKKKLKKGFYSTLVTLLPEVIEFLIVKGYVKNPEIIEIKQACFDKLYDNDFIDYINKIVKDGDEKIGNIKLFPIILHELTINIREENTKRLATDPNAVVVDDSSIVSLIRSINKSRLKELIKAGIDADVAYDILCVIPVKKALNYSRSYRFKTILNILYKYSKTKKLDFKKIVENIIKEEDTPQLIMSCLLEKKERFANLDDAQKEFYLSITSWCFDTMEGMSKDDIKSIIINYVKVRQSEESRNIDGNRRYYLNNLSEVDYPKITKIIKVMIEEDPNIKKYL